MEVTTARALICHPHPRQVEVARSCCAHPRDVQACGDSSRAGDRLGWLCRHLLAPRTVWGSCATLCGGAKNQPNLCLLKTHVFLESHETTVKQVTQQPATCQAPGHGVARQWVPGRTEQSHPPRRAPGWRRGSGKAQDPAVAAGIVEAKKPHGARFTPSA